MIPFDLEAYQRAFKALIGQTIVIPTDRDLTPRGRRTVRIVHHSLRGGKKVRWHIRWYVGSRAYHSLPISHANIATSKDWLQAGREAGGSAGEFPTWLPDFV